MPYIPLKELENLSKNISSSPTPQLGQSMVMNFSPGWNEEKIAGLLTKAPHSADAKVMIRQIPDEDLKKFSTTSKGIPRMLISQNARVIWQIPPDALAEFARTDEGIQTILICRNSRAIRAISDENLRKFSKTTEGISRMLISQNVRVIEQIPPDALAEFAKTPEGIQTIVTSRCFSAMQLIPLDQLKHFAETSEGIARMLATQNSRIIATISMEQLKAFAITPPGKRRISAACEYKSARHIPYPCLYQYVEDRFGSEPISDPQLSAKRLSAKQQYILNSTVSRTIKDCLLERISPELYEQIASSWQATIRAPRLKFTFFKTMIHAHSNSQPSDYACSSTLSSTCSKNTSSLVESLPRDQQRPEKRVLDEPVLPQKRNKIDDAANELVRYFHNFPAQAADNLNLAEPNQNTLWRPW
jgi:hypothetical protein